MLKRPKAYLGPAIAVVAFLLLLFGIAIGKSKAYSTFELTSSRNRFNLTFDLKSKDQSNFSNFIQKLNLSNSFLHGVEFELDSIPSALLNFTTPAKGKLIQIANSIEITGQLKRPLQPTPFDFQTFNFPENLNFALASANLEEASGNYLDLPTSLLQTISQNAAVGAQYVASFGDSWVYIFKTGTFDIASLKQKLPDQYKEETIDNIKIYLLGRATIFEMGDFTYIVNSLDTGKALMSAQKDLENGSHFPTVKKGNFALLFINTEKSSAPESLLIKIFGSKSRIPKFINQIGKISFTLKNTTFSGLIELK